MTDRDQRFTETLNPSTPDQSEVFISNHPIAPQVPPLTTESKPSLLHRAKNKMHRLHLFAAYCENPLNVSIQNQEPGEKILLFMRKSQWVNALWILVTALLIVFPFGIYLVRDILHPYFPPVKIILVTIPFYYLVVAIYAFLHFITWYYNAALVTTKRIVNIDFHQLVMKDVAETKINLVQDVSYNQEGVLPNMFGYGQILVQTAGTLDNFEFHQLPQPAKVVEIIEGLIGRKRFI